MRERGYTVIEAFLVVALIVAVAVIFFVFTENARAKSRDAARVAAIAEIQKALALYYTGGSSYPMAPQAIALTGDDQVSRGLLERQAIPEMPRDPKHPAYDYVYASQGQNYTLAFCLETTSIKGYQKGCGNTVTP